jgi:hypothetical protein
LNTSAKGASSPRERAEPTEQSGSAILDLLSARRADAGLSKGDRYARFRIASSGTSVADEDLLEITMRRYERASTLLTSNRPVEDWGRRLYARESFFQSGS